MYFKHWFRFGLREPVITGEEGADARRPAGRLLGVQRRWGGGVALAELQGGESKATSHRPRPPPSGPQQGKQGGARPSPMPGPLTSWVHLSVQ